MDYSLPTTVKKDLESFKAFVRSRIVPHVSTWRRKQEIPPTFFHWMADGGWYSLEIKGGRLQRRSALRQAVIYEQLAKAAPGLAVAVLAHVDLGLMALFLFGSRSLQQKYGNAAIQGKTVMCVGNTENKAGSDVAGICMTAAKKDSGWLLNGTKAYVTNGLVAGLAVVTAVSDPSRDRTQRLSMYLVDLNAEGIVKTRLNKQVWMPSDLTRLQFTNVLIPHSHLLGTEGRGLQQMLEVFTNSRIFIAAMTLGTATGAFEMALEHMHKRTVFGKKIVDFQAKAFEVADLYARIEAVRLMLWKACWEIDQGLDFRQASSLAKYLAVETTRQVTAWAADIFGAASVIVDHPIHNFPLDAWAASLGEGTQDIQKLVIFRELMRRRGNS